jgi:hypothetical protein
MMVALMKLVTATVTSPASIAWRALLGIALGRITHERSPSVECVASRADRIGEGPLTTRPC